MATSQQQQQFFTTYSPYATQAGNTLGVSPNVILGQWAFESNYGTSNAAMTKGNLAGINVPGGGGADYASYSSPQDFTNNYITTLQNPRYASALNTGSDSNAFVGGLKQGGYFTGDLGTYQSNVSSISNAAAPYAASGGGQPSPNFGYSPPGQTFWTYTNKDGTAGLISDPTFLPEGASLGPPLPVQPQTTAQGPSTAGSPGTSGTPAYNPGNLGADVGYLPPAATGGPEATGLSPGAAATVTGVGTIIAGAITGVGTTFQNFFEGLLGGLENWVGRGFLILIGIVLLFVALWRMLDPSGEKTRTMMEAA